MTFGDFAIGVGMLLVILAAALGEMWNGYRFR